jgi:hypothetical protein
MKAVVLAGILLAAMNGASRGADYSETVSGDLSNDRLSPTVLSLGAGANGIAGTVVLGDRDFFVASVPEGMLLTKITLDTYQSVNTKAFIGMQAGSAFTVDPESPDPTLLLGYTHFGIDQVIGEDLLDDLALPPEVIGFSVPLAAGDYAFWLNQTEPQLTGYGITFHVVPEPAMMMLALVGGVGMIAAARGGRASNARKQ